MWAAALGALDGQLGGLSVVQRRAVEGGGDDLTLTERCMSVTSSGRSSTSTTIRWHSGLLLVIALAMSCMIVVLPALGGDTIRAR